MPNKNACRNQLTIIIISVDSPKPVKLGRQIENCINQFIYSFCIQTNIIKILNSRAQLC